MNIILLPENSQDCVIITEAATVKHLQQVLQVKVGDSVKVGIRQGQLAIATVISIQPQAITLADIRLQQPPPTKLPLTVILALPRPKVLRRLLMDITAMGVEKLILVNSFRSEKSYWQSPLLARMNEFITEGLQQACDTVPLQVIMKKRLKPFIEDELPTLIHHKQAIVAHPYASQHINTIWQDNCHHILIIGAEGGWTEYEVALFKANGCEVAHINQRILRTENAVSVLCAKAILK